MENRTHHPTELPCVPEDVTPQKAAEATANYIIASLGDLALSIAARIHEKIDPDQADRIGRALRKGIAEWRLQQDEVLNLNGTGTEFRQHLLPEIPAASTPEKTDALPTLKTDDPQD